MTQLEPVVKPNSVADDIGRESVAFVYIHPGIIDYRELSFQHRLRVWQGGGGGVQSLRLVITDNTSLKYELQRMGFQETANKNGHSLVTM